MAKNLVIVESPAKAKTINKYLGKDFVVKASMGHVRDLPKGKLGIDVEHDFEPKYLVIKTRGDVIKDLQKSAKIADAVYLAPDPDREGEAIAWHLQQALQLSEDKTFRITFNEITKNAVKAALEHPGKINESLVNAQQARRILDRLVGYKLSPLLWEKIARGLSAGRVQSVAVRLIVEREHEIRAFKSEEYWKVIASLSKHGDARAFDAELRKKDGAAIDLANGEITAQVLEQLRGAPFRVASVEKKQKSLKASPPFSTSQLQQQASIRLRFSAKKTMRVAQQLYEGVDIGGGEGQVGLITYMRTDSYRLAEDAIVSTRQLIASTYGEKYLPAQPNRFAARKGAQEAHEAIRPTAIERHPDELREKLTSDQYRLYRMIWQRVVACQMANAVFDQTSAVIEAGPFGFAARGRSMVFDGHLRVAGVETLGEEQDLPSLAEGEELKVNEIKSGQHFTQPPPRYTEAALVKALEKNGIGRPSTYATIISTIQDRGYVQLAERKFHATELGEVVNDSLVEHFEKIVDYDFTAGMEQKLDQIEGDKADWLEVVRAFYEEFEDSLGKAKITMQNIKARPAPSGEKCPDCGKPMLLRFNRFGQFLGCSGYPECKHIQRIGKDGAVEAKRPEPIKTGELCEKCGSEMVIRDGRRGRFMACSGFPKCKNTFSVDAEGKPIKPRIAEGILCEKCEGPMVIRFSKRGPFLGCAKYPKCRGTRQLPPELKEQLKLERAAQKAAAPRGGDEEDSPDEAGPSDDLDS